MAKTTKVVNKKVLLVRIAIQTMVKGSLVRVLI